MSETLVAELLRYCKTRYGIDLNRFSGARDLLTAETCLLNCLVAVGRTAMQRWCEQLGDGYVGARATRGEVRYRFVGKRQKAMHGLFGLITYVRAYYAPLQGTGKGWVPLADQLGIGGGYTPGCQYFMARFCGEQSYEQGLEQFHEVFRPDGRELVSMNKAFEMVREVGDGLEEQRQKEIAERADEPVEVREEITGTMAASIDAGKVATRTNEQVTEDGKKSYDRSYRDAKVATVAAVKVDKEGAAHCTKTSCVTGIEHADQFFPRIEVEMSRRSGNVGALVLVVLGDGASWIWDRVADLAESGQKVWHILDFWHACDHLGKIGKELYGEGSQQFSVCYERWRSLLREGRVAAVIQELKESHASGPLQREAILRPPGRDQLFDGEQIAHGLPAVSAARSADRQRSSGERLQERGRQADETEWDDLVAGRSQGDAPAPRLRDEPPLPGMTSSGCFPHLLHTKPTKRISRRPDRYHTTGMHPDREGRWNALARSGMLCEA